jgi:hypothetical protein
VWALEYITAGGQTFTANKRTKHLKQSLDVEVKELPTTGKEIGFAPTVFYPEIWFNFDDHTCPSGIRLGFQPGDGYVSCGVGGFYADWDPGAREIALAAGINNISQIGDPSTHDWGQYHWDFMALTPDHVPLHVSPGQVLLLRNTDSGCYAAVRVDAIYGGNWTMSCIGALTDFTWHFLGCF